MALASPALAFGPNECGVVVSGEVTCSGSHTSAVKYDATAQDSLTINIAPGASATTTGYNQDSLVATTEGGDLSINLDGAVSSSGDYAQGILANSDTGAIAVTNTNSVTTTGYYAFAIEAFTNQADISVRNTGSIETSGEISAAVTAVAQSGAIEVINAAGGTISTTGDNSLGIEATSVQGDVLVENHGSILTAGSGSKGVLGTAYQGDLTMISTGVISTTGDGSLGVRLQNYGGDITADLGSVSTSGANSDAINLQTTPAGDLKLTTSGIILATGADSNGIIATSDGPLVTITNSADITANGYGILARSGGVLGLTNSGDVLVSAAQRHAIWADSVAGAVTITNTGSATTSGDFSAGLSASTQTGAIVIDNRGSASTAGVNSNAIEAVSIAGAVKVINTGSATTTGDGGVGVKAANGTGAVVIDNQGSISTGGYLAHGVEAKTVSGAITVTNANTGDITTAGMFGDGIHAESETGLISIDNQGGVLTTGYGGDGIHAVTTNGDATLAQRGDISLINRGSVSTSGGYALGIRLETVAGDITADINSVSTAGDNSDAINLWAGSGDVALNVSGTVTTSGETSDGILASSSNGAVGVTSTAAVTTTGDSSTGIWGQTDDGSVSIVSTGLISTSGYNSAGAVAQGGGAVSLTTAAVTTSGDRSGALFAAGYRDLVKIVANGPITTTGEDSNGIVGVADSGAVSIITHAKVSTAGAGSTGVVAASASGDLNLDTAAITTAGERAQGIWAESDTGKVTILARGDITTSGDLAEGIDVNVNGSGDVDITTATVATTGYSADAIRARSEGAVRVVSTGAITTEGDESVGVYVIGATGALVDVNSVSTLGAYADGIVGRSGPDLVTIKAKTINASGFGSRGIVASSESGGINVSAGAVRANGTAIWVGAGEGAVTISTTGVVTSATAGAIEATSDLGDVTINVGTGSILTSGHSAQPTFFGMAPDGVSTVIAKGVNVTINNAGLINQGESSTISASGEVVTLNNSGVINGNVDFGAGDDVVNNTGRFVLSGLSNFGGGNDRFINNGVVTMQGNATLSRLERFVNAGTINLANNHAGDVLTISGDYVGVGGRLVLDIDAAAAGGPTHDQLVIGGSASGTTTIDLTYKTAAPLKPGAVLKLVDAGGGSTAGAFKLAAEATNIGFARYGVRHDAAVDDFFIVVTEGDAVFRSLKLNEGAQTLWRQSADAWSAHTAALRDPAGASRGVWGQVYGSSDKRDETLVRTSNGVDQTVSLSYTQDNIGGQMGVDLGAIGDTGVTYGVTGGYIDSTLKFKDGADTADYKGFNLGAYVGARHGRLFANALAKYDLFDVKSRSVTAGYTETLDGRGYGLQVETGARFSGQIETLAFFFEPAVSLAYSRTDLDTLEAQGAVIDFETLNGLRAKIGARLGGAAPITQGTVSYYVGAHLVQELAGEDGVRFASGTAHSAFDNRAVGAYGQYQLGVTFTSKANLSGFVEAQADTSDTYKNHTGRIGVRVSF